MSERKDERNILEKRSLQRELSKWGELVTFDHIYSGSYRAVGMKKETEGLLIKDMYTSILHVYPVPDKKWDRVIARGTGRRKT